MPRIYIKFSKVFLISFIIMLCSSLQKIIMIFLLPAVTRKRVRVTQIFRNTFTQHDDICFVFLSMLPRILLFSMKNIYFFHYQTYACNFIFSPKLFLLILLLLNFFYLFPEIAFIDDQIIIPN